MTDPLSPESFRRAWRAILIGFTIFAAGVFAFGMAMRAARAGEPRSGHVSSAPPCVGLRCVAIEIDIQLPGPPGGSTALRNFPSAIGTNGQLPADIWRLSQ